ncbi:hypothetical protein F5Y00DRAFT_225045 [Daldinia vernicosa]|uniref:uncharacterized protein n=1 Tax=Daldinia vernicosa TaxID=114800 RepID=UPI002008930E|nr:uncharacterized protein F5Y00DRAFT_225045 [Daldinia vernicosa]KAI0853596.1 hypothetical protein F5Y00DRAFT_225045 [Daldinia vernicosa]
MIHFQPIRQNQLRRACDRCHRSKSKCLRDNDDEPCQRCSRANAECVSSPPATSRRRTQIASTQASDQELPIDAEPSQMDIDVSDLNAVVNKQHLAINPLTLPNYTPESSSSAAMRWDPGRLDLREGSSTTEESNPDLISLLERLSNLNIRLMRHLNAVPEVNTISNTISAPSQPGAKQFDIEETFHITQLFIDIINHICSRLPPPQNITTENTIGNKLPPFSLDASSELLMYSCYLRLIETYDRILRLIQASIEHKPPNNAVQYPFRMPDFTVGSFSLSSKPETQSIFLINSMDAMMARAKVLVAEATFPKQTPGYRGDFQSFGGTSLVIVPDLARNAIRTRENALFGLFEDLRKSIVQPNL